MNERELIEAFWERMATNDFTAVAPLVAPAFTLDWPQTGERIRGAENFARVNAEYPAQGPWRFTVNRIVVGDGEAVSDVTVTDGAITARAISFFTIVEGRITQIVEHWPEPSAPHANRAHLVERME